MRIRVNVQLLKDNNVPYFSIYDIERYKNLGVPVNEDSILIADNNATTGVSSLKQLEEVIQEKIEFKLVKKSNLKEWQQKLPLVGVFAMIDKKGMTGAEVQAVKSFFDAVYNENNQEPLDYITLYKLAMKTAKVIYSFGYFMEENNDFTHTNVGGDEL